MNPAAHVAQLLEQSPDLAGAVAKAAECSVPLLQRAMDDYGLLSPLQWAQIAECAEVPATWLGSGEPWHPDMIRALQRNSRAKASSVELQRLRRGNLRRLADACTHTTHLATLLNTAPSMLSDLMNSETRAASQRRAFGPRRARAMEDALGLPDGWLDRDEPVPPALGMRARQLSSAPRTRAIAARGPSVGGAAGLGDWPLPTAVAPIHQTVLAKYLDLAKAGVVDEAFAYSLLGTLLDKERPPGAAVAAIPG